MADSGCNLHHKTAAGCVGIHRAREVRSFEEALVSCSDEEGIVSIAPDRTVAAAAADCIDRRGKT